MLERVPRVPNSTGGELQAPERAACKRWQVLALTVLAQAVIIGIQSFSFSFWMVPWLGEFKATRGELMLAITGCTLAVAALAPFAGAALDRFPSRRLFCLGVIIPPLATALLEAWGWRGAFQWLAAATLFLLLPPAWWILGGFDAAEKTAGPARTESPLTTAELLRSPAFWIVALAFCAMLAPYIPLMHNLGAYASDRGIPQQTAAFIASVGAITLAVSKVAFGKLADVFDARRLYWFAMAVMVLGVIVASLATTVLSLAGGFALVTFAGGSFLPLTGKILADRFGAAFGRAMGLAMLFSTGASALTPLIVATVRDANGSYTVAFLSMLVVVPPALIAMRWLSPRPAPAA